MRIVIYADNEDSAFRDLALLVMGERYPAARLVVRNPQFYRPSEREEADLIILQDRYDLVRREYDAAGMTVLNATDLSAPLESAASEAPNEAVRRRGRPRKSLDTYDAG